MNNYVRIFDQEVIGAFSNTRKAVRVFVTTPNRKGEILIQHVSSWNIDTIPGGGIEPSELPEQAVVREVLEETGYHVNIVDYIGEVEEYRSQHGFINTIIVIW